MGADYLSERMAESRANAVRGATTPRWADVVLRHPVVFAVIFLVVVFALQQFIGRALGSDSGGSVYAAQARELIGEAISAAIVVVILLALGWWRAVGFTGFRSWQAVWLAWFPALLVVVLFVLQLLQSPLTDDVGWLGLSVLNVFGVGFFEEALTRGLVLYLLLFAWKARPNGAVAAVFVSAILFGLAHLLNLFAGQPLFATLVQIGYAIGFGVGFAALLLRTNTIWIGIVLHSLVDANSEAWFGPSTEATQTTNDLVGLTPLFIVGLPLLIYGIILMRKRHGAPRPMGSPDL
ncbi:CAAX prenyl protease-like protein [Stackebrandtia endophytica]|uniref:CAAX prenyl protease-like protein n=1 Tax=Stackebrandtia endophytica TaxID=1496996 RepID=A0A543AW41_9ACTN|nr:CPBP family intramembrane glutamic endopeptidase [Stackebrandtia endophytica]TQL76805.1 CAAX prenyl protease-like protein [Stackebrandtia endophytica]